MANVTILIPTALRAFSAGAPSLAVHAGTVAEALGALIAAHPGLAPHLYREDGRLRSFVAIYLNDDDIRARSGVDSPLADGDTLALVPAIAGGSEDAERAADDATPLPALLAARGATLTGEEVGRYSRHLILPEVGLDGQRRLKAARVLLIGAGGLGAPLGLYLAAAGVGTLGVIDADTVDASNLQRQVAYTTDDIGVPKVEALARRLAGLNPGTTVVPHRELLTSENALAVLGAYDLVVDGTDNFPTRYLVNDACVLLGRPYVYGSIFRFEGQVAVFHGRRPDGALGPCYRCLYPEPPPPGLVPSCAEGGVLGVLPGIVGTLQAAEAIKLLLGIGTPLVDRLLRFDALDMRFREYRLRRDPECPVCGAHPTITAPIDYEAFCGMPIVAPSDAAAAAAAVADGGVPEITPLALKARLDAGERLVVVDVREPHEWALGTLDVAELRLIPLGQLAERAAELRPEDEIVLQCRSGRRSADALVQLRARGFPRLWNLAGGILAWSDDVDPRLPKY